MTWVSNGNVWNLSTVSHSRVSHKYFENSLWCFQLFLTEAMSFIPEIWNVAFDVFTTLVELDSFLWFYLGSITGFALSPFASTGFAFFPAILCFATLAVSTYWQCKLPFIMIEYDPSVTDFLAVYFSFAGVLLGVTYLTFKLLFPETVRVKIMSTR